VFDGGKKMEKGEEEGFWANIILILFKLNEILTMWKLTKESLFYKWKSTSFIFTGGYTESAPNGRG